MRLWRERSFRAFLSSRAWLDRKPSSTTNSRSRSVLPGSRSKTFRISCGNGNSRMGTCSTHSITHERLKDGVICSSGHLVIWRLVICDFGSRQFGSCFHLKLPIADAGECDAGGLAVDSTCSSAFAFCWSRHSPLAAAFYLLIHMD